MKPGCLVLETGEIFKGFLFGGEAQAGEVVFNTSHSGYEEIATDPSYYNQILVMTAPLQGNYGVSSDCWQSDYFWIKGFVCLEMQNSPRDKKWLERLNSHKIPVLSSVDTRQLVIRLRKKGVVWAAIMPLSKDSLKQSLALIKKEKTKPKDWTQVVCVPSVHVLKGQKNKGPKLALIDFGFKKNILKEMQKRAKQVAVFPSFSSIQDIKAWDPDGLVLSNGPGDPKDVIDGTKLVQKLLNWRPLFGICMGHQILARALGAETYKLKFGHRGSNHPIKDTLLDKIYISAQNHGYSVKGDSLPEDVKVSHVNLNDNTVAGLYSESQNCLGVQFHPENQPGPREASRLFDFFVNHLMQKSFQKNSSGKTQGVKTSKTKKASSAKDRSTKKQTGKTFKKAEINSSLKNRK